MTPSKLVPAIAFVAWTTLAPFAFGQFGAKAPDFHGQATAIFSELNPGYCWFHPRVTAMPGLGKDGRPAVLMTIQKHLEADDHYSGLYTLRTDDLGATWTKPQAIKELVWRKEAGNPAIDLSVADVTPGWHAPSKRVVAIGIQVRYDSKGRANYERPRSYDFAYSVHDPATDKWTVWRTLADSPPAEGEFVDLCPGCGQWIVDASGDLLVPLYCCDEKRGRYATCVFRCRLDGDTLRFVEKGPLLKRENGRGLYEPSLTKFDGKHWLTLRADDRAFVTTSVDGLNYEEPVEWKFDDGKELGSYNTQAHWLTRGDTLWLAYTRRGANNDHIPRNRAPIFVSRVMPGDKSISRASEQALLPERGAMLGNFGAAAITPDEAWVTDSEYITGGKGSPKGADGTTWLGRVEWSEPDRRDDAAPRKVLLLGDSITRGERPGVTARETFVSILGRELRGRGIDVDTLNRGVGGERTDQALNRIDKTLADDRPAVVAVMYGTNDSYVDIGAEKSRITADEYRANLVELVKRIRGAGAKAVLMTPPRWGDKAVNGLKENPNPKLALYVDVCRAVAKEHKVPLVDHFAVWTDAAEKGKDVAEWTTDACHPNPAGHAKMTEAMTPTMVETLVD